MSRKVFAATLAAAAAAAALALGAGPAMAGGRTDVHNEKLLLDTFSPDGPNVVTTSASLANGVSYAVKVKGTVNIEPIQDWSHPGTCGSPERKPRYKSPGTTNGPVGWDAETVFAIPAPFSLPGFSCTADALPFHSMDRYTGGFQIDTGSGFGHRDPVGGPFSAPTRSHKYRYVVTGQGAPASFRFLDTPNDDNYGVLKISVKRLKSPNEPDSYDAEFDSED